MPPSAASQAFERQNCLRTRFVGAIIRRPIPAVNLRLTTRLFDRPALPRHDQLVTLANVQPVETRVHRAGVACARR